MSPQEIIVAFRQDAAPRLAKWISEHNATMRKVIEDALRRSSSDTGRVIAELQQEAANTKSASLRTTLTMERFRAAGSSSTRVMVGGYGLDVTFHDRTLVQIIPRATSARGGSSSGNQLMIWVWDPEMLLRFKRKWIGNQLYRFEDGPMRAHEAVSLAAEAFHRADGDLALFYKALGSQGFCALCGRALTDPLSVDRGVGPECIKTEAGQMVFSALGHMRKAGLWE